MWNSSAASEGYGAHSVRLSHRKEKGDDQVRSNVALGPAENQFIVTGHVSWVENTPKMRDQVAGHSWSQGSVRFPSPLHSSPPSVPFPFFLSSFPAADGSQIQLDGLGTTIKRLLWSNFLRQGDKHPTYAQDWSKARAGYLLGHSRHSYNCWYTCIAMWTHLGAGKLTITYAINPINRYKN